MRRFRLWMIPILSLLLSGCLSLSLSPKKDQHFTYMPYSKRVKALRKINLFFASGVVSVTYRGKTQLMEFNLKQHSPYQFTLGLSGPAGIDGVSLRGYAKNSVTLWKSMTQFVNGKSLKDLMKKEFGWYVPVPSLYYWLLGLRAPGMVGSQTFDRYGHLSTLRQKGWTIQFRRYIKQDEVDVPTILQLQGYGVILKVAVKEWSLYPELVPVTSKNELI